MLGLQVAVGVLVLFRNLWTISSVGSSVETSTVSSPRSEHLYCATPPSVTTEDTSLPLPPQVYTWGGGYGSGFFLSLSLASML